MSKSDTDKTFNQLIKILNWAEGFTLIFVISDDPEEHYAIFQRVAENLKQRACKEIKLPPTNNIRLEIEEILKNEGISLQKLAQEKPILWIYGLEASFTAKGKPAFMQALNLNRNYLAKVFPFPLVFVMTSATASMLSRYAPDFWAWRSNIFSFPKDKPLFSLEAAMADIQKYKELQELEKTYNILSDKISRLRKEHATANDASYKFDLEHKLKQAEQEREELEKKLMAIDPKTLQKYATAVKNRYEKIDFLGIPDLKDKRAMPIKTIYVDLESVNYPQNYYQKLKPKPVAKFINQHQKLVILGDPGAGKSTLLKYLTLTDAQKLEQDQYAPVPIFIILRNYAKWRTEPGREKISIIDYFYWHCNGDLNLNLPKNFLENLLIKGRCNLYFDGYDELAQGVVRDDVRKVIQDLSRKYEKNTFVITSRIAGYERVPLDKSFFHIKLTPFSDEAIKKFIKKWYDWKAKEQHLSDIEKEKNITDLTENILEKEQIKTLAGNPLLLTMIAIIHRNEASLPEERFRLYEKIIEALLETWLNYKGIGNTKVAFTKKLSRLAHLAYWMHTNNESKEKRQAEVHRKDIETKLTNILMETEKEFRDDKHNARAEAKNFLDFVNLRAGLLMESGDKLYRFLHLSFQEYLTAYYWLEQEFDKQELWEQVYLPNLPKSYYRESLLLLFALLIDNKQSKKANFVLQKCREKFWGMLQVNPNDISRDMIITDIEEMNKQIYEAYKNSIEIFLVFPKQIALSG